MNHCNDGSETRNTSQAKCKGKMASKEGVRVYPPPLLLKEENFASPKEYGDSTRRYFMKEKFLEGYDESAFIVCRWCGGSVWWERENKEKVCSKCHPKP